MKTRLTPLLIALLFMVNTSNAQEKPDSVHKLFFGIYFKSVAIKQTTAMFEADFYWWLRFEKVNDEVLESHLEDFEFINGVNIKRKIDERKEFTDTLTHKTYTYITGRTHGKFHFIPAYHLYPMDKETLDIKIESITEKISNCILIPDTGAGSNYSATCAQQIQEIHIAHMQITGLRYSGVPTVYNTNFGDLTWSKEANYSSLTYTIFLKRNFTGYVVKILIPLIIILLMAYLVYYLPPKEIEVVSALAVTSLLSAIAIQLTTSEPPCDSPKISDWIYYLCYLLITLTMAQNIHTYNLHHLGDTVSCRRYEHYGRYLFPITFVIGLAIILLYGASCNG